MFASRLRIPNLALFAAISGDCGELRAITRGSFDAKSSRKGSELATLTIAREGLSSIRLDVGHVAPNVGA